MNRIRNREIKFQSHGGFNDLWIFADHIDRDRYNLLIEKLMDSLGNNSSVFRNIAFDPHCHPVDIPASFIKSFPAKTNRTAIPRTLKEGHILDREEKKSAILKTIVSNIEEINTRYRSGPSLYFYRRILEFRRGHQQVRDFLSSQYVIEMLYATLVSWDMDSRNARMKYFDGFNDSLVRTLGIFEKIENEIKEFKPHDPTNMIGLLQEANHSMELMESKGKIVSNSKCLHFLFPDVCLPIDRTNTFQYLYDNTNETINRFGEILCFSFDIMAAEIQFEKHIDNVWNQSVPKLIDNAIILLHNKSLDTPSDNDREKR